MNPRAFFDELAREAQGHEKELAGVKAVFKFHILGQGTWRLQIDGADIDVKEGEGPAACTLTVASEDFDRLANGTLKPMVAIMERKLKVEGDLGLALKLSKLL